MLHPLVSSLTPFVTTDGDFTARQIAVLALLHDAPPEARTVRALAAAKRTRIALAKSEGRS